MTTKNLIHLKNTVGFIILLLLSIKSYSQELFVYTEPASNMATNNVGVRIMASAMNRKSNSDINFHLMPELMYGVSDKIMVHTAAFVSNRNGSLVGEGGSVYAKYKFLNNDEVQKHFRMATYGRYSFNNADIHQEEINLVGHNSGYEAGLVATQLLHKFAISSSVGYLRAQNNGGKYEFPSNQPNTVSNYTLSFGKLMLPKKYKDYGQSNLNLMCEFLGQTLLQNGKSYFDIAPSVQLIIDSKMRIDVGYRHELYSSMQRSAPNGFLVRFEYNFFNVF